MVVSVYDSPISKQINNTLYSLPANLAAIMKTNAILLITKFI